MDIDASGVDDAAGELWDAAGHRLQHAGSLVRAAELPPPAIERGYYRYQGEPDREERERDFRGFQPGDLAYVTTVLAETVQFQAGSHRWTGRLDRFRAAFRPAPDGAAERSAQMQALWAEMSAMSAQAQREAGKIDRFNPHVAATGQVDLDLAVQLEAEPLETTALAAPQVSTAVETKRAIAQVRNQVTRFQGAVEKKAALLQGYMDEQKAIMQAQLGDLVAVVERAQEAIWTINLYLGKDEEIVPLAEGARAAASEPVAIRQMVLYMDEECALAARAGGIEARSISQFDAWLVENKAHLDQVLPNARGIVALQVRRRMKERGQLDPWLANKLDEADRQTYFLLRNGENLYRMVTDFQTSDVLVPRKDEFFRLFKDQNGELLAPGTDRYMAAEKAAGASRRHYMRAALILQGLLDRTPIFHPRPCKFSVGDPQSYEPGGPLLLVTDMEQTLADGHEPYADWLARVNDGLAVGMRVVGAWELWDREFREKSPSGSYENARLAPPSGEAPDEAEIYTLEGRRGAGFYFYYPRRKRWSEPGEDPYHAVRGSATVMPDDPYLLNLDRAETAEMEYFLGSRLHRHEYARMFPVLQLALSIKQREAAEEAPFRLLLTGLLMRRWGLDAETAAAALPELVEGWKGKNKNYRALVSRHPAEAQARHAQALAEIVAEYGRRAQEAGRRAAWRERLYPKLVEGVLPYRPNLLLLAHKEGREFVALVPENSENVFVSEESWLLSRQAGREVLQFKAARRWRTVDRRHTRWDVCYRSNRWSAWEIGAPASEHLTDPERERFVRELEAAARSRVAGTRAWHSGGEYARQFLPVGLTLAGQSLRLYYYQHLGQVPADQASEGPLFEPGLAYVSFTWGRDVHRTAQWSFTGLDHSLSGGGSDWRSWWHDSGRPKGCPRVLAAWPESERAAAAARTAYRAVKAVRDAAEERLRRAVRSVARQLAGLAEAQAYAEFLAEFGDPDLWEGHQKSRKEKLPGWANSPWCEPLLAEALAAGIEIEGQTVEALFAGYQARTGKTTVRARRREYRYYANDEDAWQEVVPEAWALPLVVGKEVCHEPTR